MNFSKFLVVACVVSGSILNVSTSFASPIRVIGEVVKKKPVLLGFRFKDTDNGILVLSVDKDSLAEKAGLKVNDIIYNLNGIGLSKIADWAPARDKMLPNDDFKISVFRNNQKYLVRIKVAPEVTPKTFAELGFKTEELTQSVKTVMNLDANTNGVVVYELDYYGNAYKAGLTKNDIIVEVDRNKVESKKDFDLALSTLKSGDSVLLKVVRYNKTALIAFTLP